MDIFNDHNPYYQSASFKPTTKAVFNLQIQRRTQGTANWNHLKPIYGRLNQSNKIEMELRYGPQTISFQANTTTQHMEEYRQLPSIKYFRDRLKIKAWERVNMSEIICDISPLNEQRGDNLFWHVKDYLQPVKVFGLFQSEKNKREILDEIQFQHITQKVEQSNGDVNIVYARFQEPTYRDLRDLTQQLEKLSHGGCLVIQLQDLRDPSIIQFLYLYNKLFQRIQLSQIHLLDYNITISCYHFEHNDILNTLPQEQCEFFSLKQIFNDPHFEAVLVRFYKEVLLRRTAQLLLVQNSEANTESEFMTQCETMKEDYQQRQERRNDRTTYYAKPQKEQTKVMNPYKEVETIEITSQPQFDPKAHFKAHAQKQKSEQPKENQMDKERRKLQELVDRQEEERKLKLQNRRQKK